MPTEEEASRREGFIGGEPVRLSDESVWYVPLPMLDLNPLLMGPPDGSNEALTTFGLTFDRLVAAVGEADSAIDQARALLALAVDLLGRNYDLSAKRYRELLRYFPEDAERNETLLAIYSIATGESERTMGRWVRLGAFLSGALPKLIPLRDAYELAQFQVALGRIPPADQWVDSLRAQRSARSLESLGAC